MGQRIARRHADRGVPVYNHQDYINVLIEFEDAYKRLSKNEDDFARQSMVSEQLQSRMLQAEATFNMARAYERLGEYRTSISLCNSWFNTGNSSEISPLAGYTHLCLGNNYFGLRDVKNCLKHYDISSHVSRFLFDAVLECRVYMGLGQMLEDNVTSLQNYVRASEISRQFTKDHPCAMYQRRVSLEMAVVCSRLGRLGEALEMCEITLRTKVSSLVVTMSVHNTFIRGLSIWMRLPVLISLFRKSIASSSGQLVPSGSLSLWLHISTASGEQISSSVIPARMLIPGRVIHSTILSRRMFVPGTSGEIIPSVVLSRRKFWPGASGGVIPSRQLSRRIFSVGASGTVIPFDVLLRMFLIRMSHRIRITIYSGYIVSSGLRSFITRPSGVPILFGKLSYRMSNVSVCGELARLFFVPQFLVTAPFGNVVTLH
ncbi:RAPSN-like protein [Mya arenaria]|uniref:RAPSN-like protein n=1 Tax=Mya arenaria TaxID=6604 RepID=A0ABY7EEU3_MYAAR|nr:RAPSN-like protein [Mya arenaria]